MVGLAHDPSNSPRSPDDVVCATSGSAPQSSTELPGAGVSRVVLMASRIVRAVSTSAKSSDGKALIARGNTPSKAEPTSQGSIHQAIAEDTHLAVSSVAEVTRAIRPKTERWL